jgi:hypothetical protein
MVPGSMPGRLTTLQAYCSEQEKGKKEKEFFHDMFFLNHNRNNRAQ